ncbi:uncharacterized protein LOC108906124 [Anoplophora glabripennis]|uniref:uncharacterized protein LOC108906124 n=1 Tax=Anoplophora glabripennis TaxID=217634 RepID=UPI0008759BC0|nr:uncharacterized protein LOC108906124 [Anoplophora glabripennis]
MDRNEKNIQPSTSDGKENKSDSRKYNFYRKPSIKKKGPEVRQTLTSYKRMLKANPLLKHELEGKDLSLLSRQSQISGSGQNKTKNTASTNNRPEKQSLQANFNEGKPLITKVQRSQSVKNPPKSLQPVKKEASSILCGSKQLRGKNISSTNISRQSNVDFNPCTSRFLCSTRLESNCSKTAKDIVASCKTDKQKIRTQDNPVSNSGKSTDLNHNDRPTKNKPMRRSLSAQHFERKKRGGTVKFGQRDPFARIEFSQSMDDVSKLKPSTIQHDISPIAESSRESSIVFKTPSAYERRSIAKSTPKSILSTRRSLYRPATPLPSLYDLQKRLNDWLVKRGKSLGSFHHLKCFGEQDKELEIVDEENKENIEVNQDLSKGSYEELRIEHSNYECPSESTTAKPLVLNDGNAEGIAKAALEDLVKLIQDGYPRPQCEGWLELIRQKYQKLEEEPQYWECRAAIEQSRGNISNAVQCYRTAIVQGAEIQSVDESLDILLQKFSLLNISTKDVANEKSVNERARIVKDARNVFKSSIIQFAVQERKLKKDGSIKNEKKFVATPVRRSTRLSRSAYTSTPSIKLCSSLQELETTDREMLDFKKNKALL